MEIKLKCKGRIHGIVFDGSGLLEVRCSHLACTEQRKAVALHTFDLGTGQLKETKVFSEDFSKNRRR